MKQYNNPHIRGPRRRKGKQALERERARRAAEAARLKKQKEDQEQRRRMRGEKKRRRTSKDYKDELKLLRRFYTGFDNAQGFNSQRLSEGAKKVIRRFGPQIKQLRAMANFPHVEVVPKRKADQEALGSISPVRGEQIIYKVKKTIGKGKKRRTKIITVTPKSKRVPVFTTDDKAKIGVNEDGSIRITENGHIRDVYPIDRLAFARDPYGYMRDFMRRTRAHRVTLNVSGNVIGEVFSEWDFVDERERARRQRAGESVRPVVGLFVTIVEKYREKDTARADSFISNIGAVSVLRGGVNASNKFRREVNRGREELKELRKARRMSERARKTGRR